MEFIAPAPSGEKAEAPMLLVEEEVWFLRRCWCVVIVLLEEVVAPLPLDDTTCWCQFSDHRWR